MFAHKEQVSLLLLLAAISVGAAIGLSVGHTGLDSAVLAAVLPVIITGVAGGAAAVVLKIFGSHRKKTSSSPSADRETVAIAALAVIAFSFSYVAGMYQGGYLENYWSVENERRLRAEFEENRASLVAQRYEYVVRCTNELNRLNAIRQEASRVGALDLEPLKVGQVCIALPDGASDERPLIALAGMKGFVPLSPKTESEHYEFLLRCSFEQARVAKSRTQNNAGGVSDSTRIWQVCPALAGPNDDLG